MPSLKGHFREGPPQTEGIFSAFHLAKIALD
jgi:hypothetical protein